MFRLKVFPIIHNILNRNVYNTIHKNHIQCALFSTDALSGSSAGTSTDASNGNSDETSINASNENPTETSTDVLNETSTETTTDALNESTAEISNKTSNETLMKSTANDLKIRGLKEYMHNTSVKDSDGSSSSNVSDSIKSEPDKLYKKIEIEIRGHDKAVLKSYGEFAVMAAQHLDIDVYRNVPLHKPVHERLTVLKSAFVHKKHRVQYETRTYYRYLDFLHLTGSTADTFLEYIQRNLPEGVAMKVTTVELRTLPETVKQAVSLQ
ncbi:28S ribosomal protein S10, mitochondrial [Anthophora quadrimaculata]